MILLKILLKYPTCIDETKILKKHRPQRFILDNKLKKLYAETLEKELCSIKWQDVNKLQTDYIENKNFEIENLSSSIEDAFINTVGKVLRKTRIQKEGKVKERKSKDKNRLAKLVMTNIKS